MKPVDLSISMCTAIHLTFMILLGYFLYLCPALIRLMTDSKSGRPSLKSVCTDSVFENINFIQDFTFLHIPKAVKPGLFSVIPELILIFVEYLFLSQNQIPSSKLDFF